MRRSYNGDWISLEEEIVGINLGADFTAEHQFGIAGIISRLGVKDKDNIFGIEKRRIRNADYLYFSKPSIPNPENKRKELPIGMLIMDSWVFHKPTIGDQAIASRELQPHKEGQMVCAWDESSFGIVAMGEEIAHLEKLYAHMKKGDVAVGLGKSLGPFSNPGLVFTIISLMPEEILQSIEAEDLDHALLQKTARETGIHEVLQAAGKSYFALSPRWKDDDKKEVKFWLNPQSQNQYNYGYYTVEELMQWAKNTGPIMK
ncbi:hypothetical protein ACLBWT_18890 [Paenibacillus sp. D51F]